MQTDEQAEIALLRAKIEGLEADLYLAVSVAFHRGATEWARLNYPEYYERLAPQAPSDAAEQWPRIGYFVSRLYRILGGKRS